MNNEKIKELFADEAFVKELLALDTAAEVQAALKEKGVEMTEEEIVAVHDLLAKVESGEVTKEQVEDGELPEELLELVSGGDAGFIILGIASLIAIAMGVTVGPDGKW